MGLVDTVEVGLVPVLLGEGIPLLPGPFQQARLTLTSQKVYKSGIIGLKYCVQQAASGDANPKAKRAAGKTKSRRPAGSAKAR
jgi:dihydrofolate reductase